MILCIILSQNPTKCHLSNRGYYTRVAAFRNLIDQFLTSGGKQIISFGAGFDTNYWRLKTRFNQDNSSPIFTKYVEIDFPQVVLAKSKLIFKNDALTQLLVSPEKNQEGEITSTDYHLISVDLCDLSLLDQKISSSGIDYTLPTLFLSECVLIYIDPKDSSKLIRWTTEKFTQTMFIIYEQIKPFDSFGEVMVANLKQRGVPLASFKTYPDLNSQIKRMKDLAYTRVEALDMNQIFNKLLDPTENQRISRVEIFDEFEEWYLIQGHYCIVMALYDSTNSSLFDSITLHKNK